MAGPLTARRSARRVPVSPLRLSWPVATSITSGYGLRGARFHGGVDMVAGLGTPVAAPGSGEVVYAGWRDGGWGNAVMIAHGGGVRSLVAHLSRVDVRVGDRVRTGDRARARRKPPATPPVRTFTSRCGSAGRTSTR